MQAGTMPYVMARWLHQTGTPHKTTVRHAQMNDCSPSQVFAMVSLSSQAEVDLSAFERKCEEWPLVRECHMLNGEIDFILKCVAPDLSTFQSFLTGSLTAEPNVAGVKTSLVIRGAKDEQSVPFEVLEERLAQTA
ncbi:MAG: Lrp/AsnC ligand binding domain-containing protein [Pseudomonadota bacterium]